MLLKIRLARFGNRHSPIYNIVLTHARTARNSLPLEVLGTYDPTPRVPLSRELQASQSTSQSPSPSLSQTTAQTQSQGLSSQAPEQASEPSREALTKRFKDIRLDSSRVKYWLGAGAQPTPTVERLLGLLGLMERRGVKRLGDGEGERREVV